MQIVLAHRETCTKRWRDSGVLSVLCISNALWSQRQRAVSQNIVESCSQPCPEKKFLNCPWISVGASRICYDPALRLFSSRITQLRVLSQKSESENNSRLRYCRRTLVHYVHHLVLNTRISFSDGSRANTGTVIRTMLGLLYENGTIGKLFEPQKALKVGIRHQSMVTFTYLATVESILPITEEPHNHSFRDSDPKNVTSTTYFGIHWNLGLDLHAKGNAQLRVWVMFIQ